MAGQVAHRFRLFAGGYLPYAAILCVSLLCGTAIAETVSRVPAHTATAPAPVVLQPPSILFGELYREVEMQRVFPDQKTFADAIPRRAPDAIMADYRAESTKPGFTLTSFVAANFSLPRLRQIGFRPQVMQPITDYISEMWAVLTRTPDATEPFSSLLPLRYPYVVPGGRFTEIYYWDSYFTMLGLEQDGRHDIATDMIRNMASLIDRYGHIPNGNRTYYLSRSEPPFFACMIDLMAVHDGNQAYLTYLPELQREYDYWMEGEATLRPGEAHRHLVRLADGTLLNRYWDDRDVPRDESYREDVETAKASGRPPAEIYRELRAGGETGWDFSSRWLGDGKTLATIRVTHLLPIDLNSLIAHMEQTLSYAYALKGDAAASARYETRADTRIAAIRRLMWDEQSGTFTDYDWTQAKRTGQVTAAMTVPLFFHLATAAQGRRIADLIRAQLLKPGGLTTSLERNGQQWDSPNGWAPMQWMTVMGLRGYGENELAGMIAQRWIEREVAAYAQSGVLLEKYNVRTVEADATAGGGGEYPLQVGFGWTNGVLVSLMHLYPRNTQASLDAHPKAAVRP
ncbi:alpha,alpha-trehalase TreF [Lichenicola cladoniae]|uniref:Alpha,alpha-trehalase TreF n=1 Tax=Lichenicola cladoniae TaxID=1484109 RepID=A0A6M8HH74_9PROT|nr:alpha,alpha-trehalase TreF [Lichenicola cladoniae]NPD68544.1 alpha,alpha-trehalase TreF [Acetobacteraceae bacterium]QKE88972.1 alpha,alpha-trehalase TreF [Lichenicola cladoniae]